MLQELTVNCAVVSARLTALDAAFICCAPASFGVLVVSLVLLALCYIKNTYEEKYNYIGLIQFMNL